MIKKSKKISRAVNELILLSFCMLPTSSHAGVTLEGIINNGIAFLQGPIVRAAGVLAIMGFGYATLFMHKFSKETLLAIVLGIGIILGAPSLYTTFFG